MAEDANYRVVENWAQFPPGVAKWASVTGVDVDRNDNVYVLQRNEAMPIMVFDRNGKFLRAWGQGMFKTTHFSAWTVRAMYGSPIAATCRHSNSVRRASF